MLCCQHSPSHYSSLASSRVCVQFLISVSFPYSGFDSDKVTRKLGETVSKQTRVGCDLPFCLVGDLLDWDVAEVFQDDDFTHVVGELEQCVGETVLQTRGRQIDVGLQRLFLRNVASIVT